MISYAMDDSYRAGACNIGPAEISRRRRSALALTALAVVVAVALVAGGAALPARALLFPFAAAAAVTWLQVVRRFCVAFGMVGIRNFGALGATESVGEREARVADRRAASRLIAEGSIYGLVVTAAVMLLPA
jgi:hypothetical protein